MPPPPPGHSSAKTTSADPFPRISCPACGTFRASRCFRRLQEQNERIVHAYIVHADIIDAHTADLPGPVRAPRKRMAPVPRNSDPGKASGHSLQQIIPITRCPAAGTAPPPELGGSELGSGVGCPLQIPLTLGSPPPSSISAVSAQTSASSRSGERPDESPSGPKSHIWSSSAGNEAACTTRPCS